MKKVNQIHADLIAGIANEDFTFADTLRMLRNFVLEVRVVNAGEMFIGDIEQLRELEFMLDGTAKVTLNVSDDIMTEMYGQIKKDR